MELGPRNLVFIGQVVAWTIALATILLTVLLVISQIIGKFHPSRKGTVAMFQRWTVSHFIKVTALCVVIAASFYLLFPSARPQDRLIFIMMSLSCPIAAFVEGSLRLLRLSKGSTDLMPDRFGVIAEEINRVPATTLVNQLRTIRGRFTYKKTERLGGRVLGVVFGIVFPLILIIGAFPIGRSIPSYSDTVTCLIMAPICLGLGIFFWFALEREWEFTGEEIIARRRHSIHWRVPINSIVRAEIEITPQRVLWLRVFTPERGYSVKIVPKLLELLKEVAEPTQSNA